MIHIYGTLGPACADTETLAAMFRAGMTGMRLNLSHVSLAESAPLLASFRRAAEGCGITPELLIDLQGPELRVPALPAPLHLAEGSLLLLGDRGLCLPVPVLQVLAPGQQLLLDDGKLLLEISACTEEGPVARVLRGGELKGRKSIALPGRTVPMPALTAADRENLQHAAEFGVTAVMQPFVRNAEDLREVRSALNAAGCAGVRLLAKIENPDGVAQLPQLLPEADEIVIARGDLGNSMPLWELPRVQKELAARCRAAGKPFMVVTQMLDSMTERPVPTRAEVSDIYNAVLDGASSVMVTGETAAGRYPVEVIRYLANTAHCAEKAMEL